MWLSRRRYLPLFATVCLLLSVTWFLSSLGPLPDLSTSEHVIPVSAYFEPNFKAVRIFFLKHTEAYPKIYCSFVNSLQSGLNVHTTPLHATRSKYGWPFNFDRLVEYKGVYRGYVTFCDISREIKKRIHQNSLSIRIHLGAVPSNIQLPVQTGRINPKQSSRTKHRLSMCMTPWFGTDRFDPAFVIEFIELQRVMGVTQLVLYLTEELRPELKRVLSMYTTQEKALVDARNFELKLVNWMLPIEDPLNTTWYFDQVLSFNDCLNRIGSVTQYIFFGDWDEILVPNEGIRQHRETLPTWNDVVHVIESHPDYRSAPALCFPSYYFPPPSGNNSKEQSIFDRTNATIEAYSERKKCLIRPNLVEEVYVHWPIQPRDFLLGTNLAVIFHYRVCLRKNYDLCDAETQYAPNNRLAAYRALAQKAVAFRRSGLSWKLSTSA